MRRLSIVVATLFLTAALGVAVLNDDWALLPVTGDFNNTSAGVTDKDVAWKKFDSFFGVQRVYLVARLDQGYWLFDNIFTFKYGPQQVWGVYALVVSDDGKSWLAKRQVEPSEAKVSYDGIGWESKGTIIKGSPPNYVHIINEAAFKANLTVQSYVPGWKQGLWKLTPDGKSYGVATTNVPWGSVEGTLTLDGKTIPVTGRAFVDDYYGSYRFDRYDPLNYVVRGMAPMPGSPDISVEAGYVRLNPHYGKISLQNLFVLDRKKWIKASGRAVIRGEEFYKDPKLGYLFPKRLIIRSEEGDFKLSGVFKADRNLEIMDVLSNLSAPVRKIAETFFKTPVFSKWDGVLEGVYSIGGVETKFKLRALAELNYIGGKDAEPVR